MLYTGRKAPPRYSSVRPNIQPRAVRAFCTLVTGSTEMRQLPVNGHSGFTVLESIILDIVGTDLTCSLELK